MSSALVNRTQQVVESGGCINAFLQKDGRSSAPNNTVGGIVYYDMVGDTRPYFRRRRQKHTQAEFLQVQFITDTLMLVRSWSNVRKHILNLVWCHCFAIHGGHSVTFVPTIEVQIVIHETSRDVLLLGLGQIGLFDSSTKGSGHGCAALCAGIRWPAGSGVLVTTCGPTFKSSSTLGVIGHGIL